MEFEKVKADIADHPGKKYQYGTWPPHKNCFFDGLSNPEFHCVSYVATISPWQVIPGRLSAITQGDVAFCFRDALPRFQYRFAIPQAQASVVSLSKSNWDLKSGVSFISQFHLLRISSGFFTNFSHFTTSFIFHWFPPSSCLVVRLFISIHFFLQFLQNQISWWRGV